MKKTKKPEFAPSRVFSIEMHPDGIRNRINAMGFNIAMVETKLELSQMVELEFQKFAALKKYHT